MNSPSHRIAAAARVAKLVDASDLKSEARRGVPVRVRSWAPSSFRLKATLSDVSANMAAMVTGLGDGTVPVKFEADDVVGIDH